MRVNFLYKITKIVSALWLAERRVCIRVCKHGCEVKMFCFSGANHASTNLKKVFQLKTRQVYFIYLFPRRLKLGKSVQKMLCQFFFAKADILSEKNTYFGKPLFCKTRTDLIRLQDFVDKTSRLVRISLLISAITKSFTFFLRKIKFKKAMENIFLYLHSLI